MKEGKLYVGTSGWMYKDWEKTFYPENMKKGFLTYLAGEFNTVEVNNSFYHLPTLETFKKWYSETPDHFLFAVKLSRFITHLRKLKDTRQSLERFLNNAMGLDKKLGIILIQLPPALKFEEELLENFFSELNEVTTALPCRPRIALETRNKSFVENREDLFKILKRHRITLVFAHSSEIPSFPPENENILSDFIYARFHGPFEFASSRYGKELLIPWAEKMVRWLTNSLDVFAYFNNDQHGYAIQDARDLKECCKMVTSYEL